MIFGRILKEEFETTITKRVERMEACLVANRQYFEKENVKYTTLEKEDDVREYICVFVHFFPFYRGICATVFTKPAVTRDLIFDA